MFQTVYTDCRSFENLLLQSTQGESLTHLNLNILHFDLINILNFEKFSKKYLTY